MLHQSSWRTTLTLLVVLAGLVLSVPTMFSRDQVASWPKVMPHQQISLGLDLQGGSHLLLEVDVGAVVKERLESLVDEVRNQMRNERLQYTGLGVEGGSVVLRLRDQADFERGRTVLRALARPVGGNVLLAGTAARDIEVVVENDGRVRMTLSKEAIEDRRRAAVDQSMEIVRRRVDQTGTKEPIIQRQGAERILVQLPGEQNPDRIKRLLGQTAKLSFRLVDLTAQPGSSLPPGSEVLLVDPKSAERGGPRDYVVRRQVMVSGENLVDAQPAFDQQTGQPVVNFRFDSAGGRRFGQVTSENVGKPFAIVLDGKVISAPVIRQAIIGGSGQISGGFSVQEANDLALLLRAGALPAPLKVLEERTVGPDLGADSVRAGTITMIIAFVLVVAFMVMCYGLFGAIANVALVGNIFLIIAALSLLQATLTLPGIAGIVLTVGMAVDANVLIFERIREEFRLGKTPVAAIDSGFRFAWGTIIDTHVTTFIAAALLFLFGTGPVKGFAVTLAIGIVASIFTATTFTHLMVVYWLRWMRPRTVPI
ncbi:MAG: protein translocase subunit SecD [Alphaproteobacteria bacterium]|nr:protein translocase subunit SecD [Alphaproteobacteria bacterium]